jgi:transketolase
VVGCASLNNPEAGFPQGEWLKEKAGWVRRETLRVHQVAPSTRIASSLSPVEIFTALYYGRLLRFNPKEPYAADRDRLIISKGHGSIALYPILADVGYFDNQELRRVGTAESFLGGIPDPVVPGFETVNGSLGHGLGVGSGVALALQRTKNPANVLVLMGDGELYEGAVWEALLLAPEHHLDNLLLIVDYNKISMLDYCANIIQLEPLIDKFKSFGWVCEDVDGHDVQAVHASLQRLMRERGGQPKVLLAHTVKGKGVPMLEKDSFCHLRTLTHDESQAALEALR